ncbi:MAG: hypothetical protein H0U56_01605 [Methylibium sp.]|uniref:hypothetical protein n=1 Tax=Methylibium sp. TaxID=2067992 RepID=UPI0017FA6BE8|nr:hypothetical protein [Methylibium sp.]MBA2721594.1 hypothetical protein [Methylibium sp.]MBA3589580.1 hypothetical protein [Methylibium sp.]
MKKSDHPEAFGVFKPVGHVVVSFPEAKDMKGAADALAQAGFGSSDVVRYTPQEMLSQIDEDMANASVLASIGQEMNLVKAHRALAEKGFHWLVVKASADDQARRVADVVRPFNAERAQKYGRLLIEELIEHRDDERQMPESPSRGLDAQTPSGRENER